MSEPWTVERCPHGWRFRYSQGDTPSGSSGCYLCERDAELARLRRDLAVAQREVAELTHDLQQTRLHRDGVIIRRNQMRPAWQPTFRVEEFRDGDVMFSMSYDDWMYWQKHPTPFAVLQPASPVVALTEEERRQYVEAAAIEIIREIEPRADEMPDGMIPAEFPAVYQTIISKFSDLVALDTAQAALEIVEALRRNGIHLWKGQYAADPREVMKIIAAAAVARLSGGRA